MTLLSPETRIKIARDMAHMTEDRLTEMLVGYQATHGPLRAVSRSSVRYCVRRLRYARTKLYEATMAMYGALGQALVVDAEAQVAEVGRLGLQKDAA